MFLSTESGGRLPRKFLGNKPQHLKRALESLRRALEVHYRSLEGLESALVEFEETLGGQEEQRRQERPQVQQQEGAEGGLDLLSITDVCGELGMGKSWVYRRIQSGEIPSVKLGRNIKVRREDLEGYLEGQRYQPTTYDDSASE
jgi:excisionase family DNA binding protein